MKENAFSTHLPAALRAALIPLMVGIVVLPSGLFYLTLASSTAMGAMIANCLALLLCFTLLKTSRRRLAHDSQLLLLLLTGIVAHLLAASTFGSIDFYRGVASLLPLFICLAGGWAISALFTQARSVDLTHTLKICLALLGLIAFLGAMGWLQPLSRVQYSKPVFPFSEPSHLALILTPILIFVCVSSAQWRRPFYLAIAVAGTIALENLTMAAACLVAALLCMKLRQILVLILFLTPAVVTLDLTYYSERLVFDIENQNLSALVYIQGWQLVEESLQRSNGFGLGFQQLGVFGTEVEASDQIRLLMGDSLNLLDGGFNAAKLLSEFGVFGALLLTIYIYYLIASISMLWRVVHHCEKQPAVLLFAASCIIGYVIELFVRGTGYFTSTGTLLVFSLLTWHRFNKPFRKTIKRRPLRQQST